MLHAVRRHWLVILSTGLACAAVTGTVCSGWVLKPQYKATGLLELAPSNPKILKPQPSRRPADHGEFEIFRENQAEPYQEQLRHHGGPPRSEIEEPVLHRPQEDAKHNAIAWLTDEIHVDFPSKNAGIMKVIATEPDREDAAAIVNAVVDAYMDEVVNRDRQQRRDRLTSSTKISAEKENEVRTKREQLKRELENIGAGDEQTMAARGRSLAVNMYAEFQRQFQAMKSEHRMLHGKLQESTQTLRSWKTPTQRYRESPRPRWSCSSTTIPCTAICKAASRCWSKSQDAHHDRQMAQPGMKPKPRVCPDQGGDGGDARTTRSD